MHRPKTIQIFLPTGDPRGVRVAEITTRIVRVIDVPRSRLEDFAVMPESQQVGIYFLVDELSEAELRRVYIGQSGAVGKRLEQHHQNKDFWSRAFVVISLTNSLTQTHAQLLEWLAIADATKAGRYSLENGNTGSQAYTPAPLQADCQEIHETAGILLATLGQPIFDSLATSADAEGETEIFYCKGSGSDGEGQYTSEGFVVLKGSKGRVGIAPSLQGTSNERMRNLLVTKGVLTGSQDSNGRWLVFTRDHLCSSPSTAAMLIMGRSSNGWVEWKNLAGQTLDEVKRQPVQSNTY